MRTLLAITAVTICCFGNQFPAHANCSGSWSGSSFSGNCRDNYGGSYRVNGGSGRSTRVNGYTSDGDYTSGTIRNGRFSGYVGDDYVTCDRYSCY